ncbi:MAG: hypothetical protein AB9856_03435 [Cellulosilyticaceae bacterium]
MAFGNIIFTNKGRLLQAKAETGIKLNFSKIAIGDGELTGQSILELTDLVRKKKDISISGIKLMQAGYASIRGKFTNNDINTGFYFRELGLYAIDPEVGEILYCYGNAGALAEYIPPIGGSEIIEKQISIEAIIGNANNINAQLNSLDSTYIVIPKGTDIPTYQRDPSKLYFKVTDTQTTGGGINGLIKVSPTMGIKIEQE